MTAELSAERFVDRLSALGSTVSMGQVFGLAKEFIELPPSEIEKLLASPTHLVRVGALSIMDKQARRKRTTPQRRQELFELYLGSPDRIDTWDLVDLGAPYVIGCYLFDKPREVLYRLAVSTSPWERHAAEMPRIMLSYAIEHLDDDQRAHYRGLRKAGAGS